MVGARALLASYSVLLLAECALRHQLLDARQRKLRRRLPHPARTHSICQGQQQPRFVGQYALLATAETES